MTEVYRTLTPEEFGIRLPELAEVYALAFSGPPYYKPADELNSFQREAREHLERPGFRAWAAFELSEEGTIGKLVGFTYAYQLLPSYWWYQQVVPHLKRTGQESWLEDSYELTQMAVRPEFQGRGLGGGLHDRLLAELSNRHGLLSTLYGETNATGMYRRRGWRTLLEPFQFSGVNRPYRIMGRMV